MKCGSQKSNKSCRLSDQAGLTLVELLVVMVILIGVGSIFTATFSDRVQVRGADGESREMGEVVTLDTMRTVRDALIGTPSGDPGYRGDLGKMPSRLGALIENIDTETNFSPASRRGWRGPYIVHEGLRYGDFTGTNFPTNTIIPDTDPAILDGWGRALLLGQETGTGGEAFVWLVSAGPNRELETDLTTADHDGDSAYDYDGVVDRGDDIVLFLLTSDPN
ncbi:MAG: type II secretion system protein [Verrucomicrobiota bacterium]